MARSSKPDHQSDRVANPQRDLVEAVAKLKILARPVGENVAIESYLELCDILTAALSRGPLSDEQVKVVQAHFDRATAVLLEELETWRPLPFSNSALN